MRSCSSVAIALLLAAESAAAAAASPELVAAVVRKLAADKVNQEGRAPPGTQLFGRIFMEQVRQQNQDGGHPERRSLRRSLEDKLEDTCDAAFLGCLKSDNCVDCFVELETKSIDWASVTKDTPCTDVVKFLYEKQHCLPLKADSAGQGTFCNTFDSCVDWGEDDKGDKDDPNKKKIKCSELEECNWEGMHEQFIGDGICHDKVEGCYNSEICGYDGGDCCEDTCKPGYVDCGHEDFVCRDPNSSKCERSLNPKCENKGDKKNEIPVPVCEDGATVYRVIMFDSFGDGWDNTKLDISDAASISTTILETTLKDGSQGTDYVCLSKTPACYQVEVKGGVWGKEVSWEVRPMSEGAPSLASGGSPMTCTFPVAGDSCENTCTGKTGADPTKDPDYKEFKTMTQCINDKCPVQIGACEADDVCVNCFKDVPADYCYADDFFNALLDCAICKCTDSTGSDYCNSKNAPGIPSSSGGDDDAFTQDPCSPAETVTGGNAVLAFGKCSDFDQASMMVTDFDQNNFGMLDQFESCSHAYKNRSDRGGHTALGCLQILVNAKDGAFNEETTAPKEAVQALASHLYDKPKEFCDCAQRASKDCPLCPSFMNFKTLLYETLDACQSLDEIDCDAWAEFAPKCQGNLVAEKGGADFTTSTEEKCKYVHDGCGGAGPFPVFRRIDCDKEVSADAWSFYAQYSNSCLSDQEPIPTPPGPGPTPVPPTPPAPTPTPPAPPAPSTDDYITPVSPTDKKPYVPPEERGKKKKKKKSADGSKPKKKSHFLRNMFWLLVVGGGAYYYYKNYGFDFSFLQRYRRFRPLAAYDSNNMYTGLTMESSTSFQPPTLPPTPIDMGSGAGNGGHYI